MNIALWLHSSALTQPQAAALYRGQTLVANYGQFADRACALGKLLQSTYGLQKGERVAIYMPNRIEYLIILYACWWVGAVAVPINHMLHPQEAHWIINNSESKLVFTDSGDVFSKATFAQPCQEVALDGDIIQHLQNTNIRRTPPRTMPGDALAWLFYTSGTTGRPKGVMLSHDNLVAMSLCYFADVDHVDDSQTKLYAAPMSHGAGLYNFMFVRAGARHVVPESRGFNSTEILNLAAQLDNLSFFAAPTMCKRLVSTAQDLGSKGEGIHLIVLGGGPMYAADLLQALEVFGPKIAQIYGQGESPMTITAMPAAMIGNKDLPNRQEFLSSVGKPHSCIELRIVDKNMHELPVGQSGEILVRGLSVMQGYWRNADETAQTLVDGWLRTGDIGFVNEQGLLTLTDRARDLIISGGANVYPREVEEVLVLHPHVFEAAVVGAPSSEWGEEVVAFVVVEAGQQTGAQELEDWCTQHIASYKKPKHYIFVDELPKNSYGKVLKTELRQQLQENNERNNKVSI